MDKTTIDCGKDMSNRHARLMELMRINNIKLMKVRINIDGIRAIKRLNLLERAGEEGMVGCVKIGWSDFCEIQQHPSNIHCQVQRIITSTKTQLYLAVRHIPDLGKQKWYDGIFFLVYLEISFVNAKMWPHHKYAPFLEVPEIVAAICT